MRDRESREGERSPKEDIFPSTHFFLKKKKTEKEKTGCYQEPGTTMGKGVPLRELMSKQERPTATTKAEEFPNDGPKGLHDLLMKQEILCISHYRLF